VINRGIWTLCVFASLALVGCTGKPAAKADGSAQRQPAAVTPAPGPEGSAPQVVTGTVVETMDAASYTYVRVRSSTGDVWAATTQFKVAVGDRVEVPLEVPMQNFESKSLKRTFPLIYFVSHVSREGETPSSAASAALPPGHPSVGGAPSPGPAAEPVGKVDPAPGGMTVADVWAQRQTLSGKSVVVRGKVVKFNGGIMGKNWIHIQDGTGSAKDGTHDLTVTSNGAAKIGDVITITGKVSVDKDFGAGYTYPVIVEGAAIVVK
jgi:hypothetical protein